MNATEPIAGRFARAVTLLITWVTKLTGLVSASDQLFLHGDHPSSIALAVSAFMMAGAQVSEGLILAAIDRLISAGESGEPGKSGDSAAPSKRDTTSVDAKTKARRRAP